MQERVFLLVNTGNTLRHANLVFLFWRGFSGSSVFVPNGLSKKRFWGHLGYGVDVCSVFHEKMANFGVSVSSVMKSRQTFL